MLPSTGLTMTVNVAVPSFSMSLVAFMATNERGYYRQEGLEVNFVLMPAVIASRAWIAGMWISRPSRIDADRFYCGAPVRCPGRL